MSRVVMVLYIVTKMAIRMLDKAFKITLQTTLVGKELSITKEFLVV